MGVLDSLFGRKATATPLGNEPAEQAVLVLLRGTGLPSEVYEQYDVATLEDQLMEVIERDSLGELDGNEFGPDGVMIYMYSPDAERLYEAIESTLRAYPLCDGATVTIRLGGPGAQERVIKLACA